jgi:hypothetical protein
VVKPKPAYSGSSTTRPAASPAAIRTSDLQERDAVPAFVQPFLVAREAGEVADERRDPHAAAGGRTLQRRPLCRRRDRKHGNGSEHCGEHAPVHGNLHVQVCDDPKSRRGHQGRCAAADRNLEQRSDECKQDMRRVTCSHHRRPAVPWAGQRA